MNNETAKFQRVFIFSKLRLVVMKALLNNLTKEDKTELIGLAEEAARLISENYLGAEGNNGEFLRKFMKVKTTVLEADQTSEMDLPDANSIVPVNSVNNLVEQYDYAVSIDCWCRSIVAKLTKDFSIYKDEDHVAYIKELSEVFPELKGTIEKSKAGEYDAYPYCIDFLLSTLKILIVLDDEEAAMAFNEIMGDMFKSLKQTIK